MPDKADNAMPARRGASQEAPGTPAFDPEESDTTEFLDEEGDDAAFDEAEEPDEAGEASELPTGDPGERRLFDEGDDGAESFARSEPDSAPEPVHQTAPDARANVHGGVRGQGAGARVKHQARGLPVYLESLCKLPGVDRESFENLDHRTAVIELWCTKPRCNHDKMPIAHLAPDALEVLAEMRFAGHVRAAVYKADTERQPLFNTAFKMPAREGEDESAPAQGEEVYRLEQSLRAEIDTLKQQLETQGVPQNPLAPVREGLKYVRELIAEAGKIKAEIRSMAGTEGDPNGDPGDEGGGTVDAIMAVGVAKAQEFAASETGRKMGAAFLKWAGRLINGGKEVA